MTFCHTSTRGLLQASTPAPCSFLAAQRPAAPCQLSRSPHGHARAYQRHPATAKSQGLGPHQPQRSEPQLAPRPPWQPPQTQSVPVVQPPRRHTADRQVQQHQHQKRQQQQQQPHHHCNEGLASDLLEPPRRPQQGTQDPRTPARSGDGASEPSWGNTACASGRRDGLAHPQGSASPLLSSGSSGLAPANCLRASQPDAQSGVKGQLPARHSNTDLSTAQAQADVGQGAQAACAGSSVCQAAAQGGWAGNRHGGELVPPYLRTGDVQAPHQPHDAGRGHTDSCGSGNAWPSQAVVAAAAVVEQPPGPPPKEAFAVSPDDDTPERSAATQSTPGPDVSAAAAPIQLPDHTASAAPPASGTCQLSETKAEHNGTGLHTEDAGIAENADGGEQLCEAGVAAAGVDGAAAGSVTPEAGSRSLGHGGSLYPMQLALGAEPGLLVTGEADMTTTGPPQQEQLRPPVQYPQGPTQHEEERQGQRLLTRQAEPQLRTYSAPQASYEQQHRPTWSSSRDAQYQESLERQLQVEVQKRQVEEEWQHVYAEAQQVEQRRHQLEVWAGTLAQQQRDLAEQGRRLQEAEARVYAKLGRQRELELELECFKDRNSQLLKEKDDLMYDMDMALVDLDHARTEMQRLQAQTAATAAAPYDSQAAAGAATPLSPAADGSSVHMLQSAFDAVTTSYTYPSPCCSAAPCTDPRPHQHHPHIHKPAPLSSLTAAPPLLRHDPSLLLPGRDPELGFEAGELAHAARAFGEQVLDTATHLLQQPHAAEPLSLLARQLAKPFHTAAASSSTAHCGPTGSSDNGVGGAHETCSSEVGEAAGWAADPLAPGPSALLTHALLWWLHRFVWSDTQRYLHESLALDERLHGPAACNSLALVRHCTARHWYDAVTHNEADLELAAASGAASGAAAGLGQQTGPDALPVVWVGGEGRRGQGSRRLASGPTSPVTYVWDGAARVHHLLCARLSSRSGGSKVLERQLLRDPQLRLLSLRALRLGLHVEAAHPLLRLHVSQPPGLVIRGRAGQLHVLRPELHKQVRAYRVRGGSSNRNNTTSGNGNGGDGMESGGHHSGDGDGGGGVEAKESQRALLCSLQPGMVYRRAVGRRVGEKNGAVAGGGILGQEVVAVREEVMAWVN